MNDTFRLNQIESDIVRLKKLVNYLMIDGDKLKNSGSGYLLQALAFQKDLESSRLNSWLIVGVVLPTTEYAKETNGNQFKFILVDLLGVGIKKEDIPRTSNESNDIDWSRFAKIRDDVTSFISIYRPEKNYLNLSQDHISLSLNANDPLNERLVVVQDGYLVSESNGAAVALTIDQKLINSNFFENYSVEDTGETGQVGGSFNGQNGFKNYTMAANLTINFKNNKFTNPGLYIYKNEQFINGELIFTQIFDPSPRTLFEYYYQSNDYLNFNISL